MKILLHAGGSNRVRPFDGQRKLLLKHLKLTKFKKEQKNDTLLSDVIQPSVPDNGRNEGMNEERENFSQRSHPIGSLMSLHYIPPDEINQKMRSKSRLELKALESNDY